MFNREKFANILKNINELYDNQTSFAKKAYINRTYLSQYMNLKLNNPPSPKKLKGIADASQGITTYEELMEICGHVAKSTFADNSIVNPDITALPLFVIENGELLLYSDLWIEKKILNYGHTYFGLKSNDDSMLPLIGIGDIVIIEKTNSYKNGNTYLISLDNNSILIRKIIVLDKYIELYTVSPYSQPIKLTNEEIQSRKFKVIGKVIKTENTSAFK